MKIDHADWRRWIALMLLAAIATSLPGLAIRASAQPSAGSGSPTSRVLVELRVATSGDREAAIAAAQREVLARLSGTRAAVVRRYRSVPLMALEVDAEARARLEQMTDLVTGVVPDAPARTQGGS